MVMLFLTITDQDRVFHHRDYPLAVVQQWQDDPLSYKIVLQCEQGTSIQVNHSIMVRSTNIIYWVY